MSTLRFHNSANRAGREKMLAEIKRLNALEGHPPKMAALPSKIVFKQLLSAERGKLGVCPSTRLEAFKATPFPGSFKLGLNQRLHRWLCDECGFWHGQVVSPDDCDPPPDEPTNGAANEVTTTPTRHPDSVEKKRSSVGSRVGKISRSKQ